MRREHDARGLAEPRVSAPAAQPLRPVNWIAVVGLSQGWKLLISIVSSAVLGRLLTPGDFGLIATVGPIIAFADLFRDLGLTQAVVQQRDISDRQVNALFWLSIAVTCVIVVAFWLSSAVIARFFAEPRIGPLLQVASSLMVLSTLSALPLAWLNRDLKFYAIAVIEVASVTLGFLAAALCAWITQSYWSLIVGSAVYGLTNATTALIASGWYPGRPSFDAAVKEMTKFGVGISTANLSNFIARNSDNFLIARASGPVPLGYYDRAYKLMLVPLAQMTWPVSRVLIPILSRQVDTPERYRRTYTKTIAGLMTVGQPGLLFCVVFADTVIRVVLGPEWGPSAPIFAWLAVASLQQLATSSVAWLFISQGRGRDYATLGVINSALAVASFLIGLRGGPLGVAISFTLVDTFVRAPLSWWFTTRRGPVSLAVCLATIGPHLVALATCTAGLLIARDRWPAMSVPAACLGVALTYLVYLATLALFPSKRELLREAIHIVERGRAGLSARLGPKAPSS